MSLLGFHAHAETHLDTGTDSPPIEASPVLDLNAFSTVQQTIPALAEKRVVFIGEQHTRYDHHLVQLEIIRRLHALHPKIAIGMEMFQQPFQQHLDTYVAGDLNDQAMLRATEYYQRWRMDYRYYAPVLHFAREHGLPLIALDAPAELTRKVAHVGLDGLQEHERQQLPTDIEAADDSYRQRVKEIFDYHPKDDEQQFEHFLEAQLVWDESMAERAAGFMRENPDHILVVLAGNQHIAWNSGIPSRLQQRLSVPAATILNSWDGPVAPGLADFLLMPAERPLPPAGKIGALLESDDKSVIISACDTDSACAIAGIRGGDRITTIDGQDINGLADLRLALWDKAPGDVIQLETRRKRLLFADKEMSYELTLK
jgi:uncharacterized iron-regulated protein